MGFFAVNVTALTGAAGAFVAVAGTGALPDAEYQRRAVVIDFLHPDELFHAVTLYRCRYGVGPDIAPTAVNSSPKLMDAL